VPVRERHAGGRGDAALGGRRWLPRATPTRCCPRPISGC
jgi:hypothetical protein